MRSSTSSSEPCRVDAARESWCKTTAPCGLNRIRGNLLCSHLGDGGGAFILNSVAGKSRRNSWRPNCSRSIRTRSYAATVSEREEPQFRSKWLIVLLLSLAAILLTLEVGTRIGFRLISKIESRTMMEARAAPHTQPFVDGRPSMLLVGNSLMLEDVDYAALKRQLASRASVSRFVIEQTYYYDWYFGIRRLFAEGARPREIVLGIQPSVIPMDRIRGDYSAYYLISGSDLLDAARAMHYDLTQTSGLAFAHFSLFYAGRNNLRNFILNKVDPKYGELLHALVTNRAPVVMSAEAARISTDRLAAINRLCHSHGARFIYFVPPALGQEGNR